jgi:hypothetical protein
VFALWLLRDNFGWVQTYVCLADMLSAHADLLAAGVRPTWRRVEVTPTSDTIH